MRCPLVVVAAKPSPAPHLLARLLALCLEALHAERFAAFEPRASLDARRANGGVTFLRCGVAEKGLVSVKSKGRESALRVMIVVV